MPPARHLPDCHQEQDEDVARGPSMKLRSECLEAPGLVHNKAAEFLNATSDVERGYHFLLLVLGHLLKFLLLYVLACSGLDFLASLFIAFLLLILQPPLEEVLCFVYLQPARRDSLK